MNLLDRYSSLSIYRVIALLVLYVLLCAIFSLQTIYYYNYENLGWWLYFFCMTCAFYIAVFYCLGEKRSCLLLFTTMAFFIGYMPYEVVLPRIVDLIVNPKPELSGLSQILPSYLRVLIDVLFYPFLVFILLLSMKKITLIRRKQA